MSFWVDPAEVASYAKQVERAAEHARAAKDYASKNCEISSASFSTAALFQKALTGHNTILRKVRANLDRGRQVLAAATGGLGAAASLYQRLDEATARRLDATYPDLSRRRSASSLQTGEPDSPRADRAER